MDFSCEHHEHPQCLRLLFPLRHSGDRCVQQLAPEVSHWCLARHGQVLEWTQTMLRVGEAFSGEPCASLRDAVQRQSGRFFQVANRDVVQSVC